MKTGLGYRLCSGITLGALVLAAIFLDGWTGRGAFLAFGMGMVFAAVAEYLAIMDKLGAPARPISTAAFSAVVMGCLVAFDHPEKIVAGILLAAVVAGWLAPIASKNPKLAFSKTAVSFSALPFLLLPLGFLAAIYLDGKEGRMAFLFLLLVVKMGDTGAYAVGTTTAKLMPNGNHKIAPKISPKKSWEGTCGGLAASVGVAIACRQLLPSGLGDGIIVPAVVGALLFIGGFFGDLAESALKRAADVKDSGGWMPGLGGALDTLDSLLLNAPLFYVFLAFATRQIQ
jgi:phosphatidate cytidylyltransferase